MAASRGSSGEARKRKGGAASKDAKPRGSTASSKTKPPAKSVEGRTAARTSAAAKVVPHGPAQNAFDRVMQASFIGIRRAQGATWKTVAREVGLSDRRCQELHKQLQRSEEQSHTLKRDPTELIEWILIEHERDLSAFTLAALTADSGSARVGALNGREKTLERIVALLQSTNRLPRNLGTISVIHDLRVLGAQINVLMVGIEQGEFDREHVQKFFARLTGRPELPPVREEEIVELRSDLVRDAA